MRADSLGLFWQDRPAVKKSGKRGPREWGPMPAIPATGWMAPTEFPNLSGAKMIGVDTETYDPELTDAGPGWGRGKGHIVGVSLAVEDGSSWYFPMRHEVEPEHNMDPEQVLRYLKHTLGTPTPKAGANLIYDVGWLQWEGVPMAGKLYDVQFAEALLDSETPSVALDKLANKYLGVGKQSEILYEWLAQWNSGAVNDKQRKWLYKTPPQLAGPYAQADASLPIAILKAQWERLWDHGVFELFDLECRLIPLLVAMRMKGAPVDIDKSEEIVEKLDIRIADLEVEIQKVAGQPVNPAASESMKSAFTRLGITIPTKFDKKTKELKTTFDKDALGSVDHPLAELVLEHRKLTKVSNTFVKSYIQKKHVNGRLHCTFHPLKGLTNGARSGRFASSDPNLQNIPVRTAEGQLVREAFAVDPAFGRWRAFDYSSIEYRLLAHYAVGAGADEVRAIYAMDPDADYHKIVGALIEKLTGLVLARAKVKTINFGLIYGMALAALSKALKLPKNKAAKLIDDYHKAAPYASATMEMCADEVHATGQVRTILNRCSDFNAWGSKNWEINSKNGFKVYGYREACAKWGMYNIERMATHKALNRKLQGSAADIMKKAMVDAWEGGLFHESACGIPVLTVHDELDFEDLGYEDNPAWYELERCMENCMGNKLRVPLRVDGKAGKNWRETK